MHLTFGSLFSGAGGIDLEQACRLYGNAVTVPVFRQIGEYLKRYDDSARKGQAG